MEDIIMAAGWSVQSFETNVRAFLGILAFIALGWRALTAYLQGQKGRALFEGIIGIVVTLLITGKETAMALADGIKSILGF